MEAELCSGKKLVVIKKHGFESQIFYLVIVLQEQIHHISLSLSFHFCCMGIKMPFLIALW